jgi:hypothetical protein
MDAKDLFDNAQDSHDNDGWSRPDGSVSGAAWARSVNGT